MDYSTVDFMEVRNLVLQYELEPDPQARLDDVALFRSSNEVTRAKLAICNLRERAMRVNQRSSVSLLSGQQLPQHLEDAGSIWFNESIFSELQCMIPIAVAHCPDLLYPEILVHAVLTTKNAGQLLKACFLSTPMLMRECIELLTDFIFRWAQVKNVGGFCKPFDPLFLYCLQQSYNVMEFFCQSESHIALTLREALVRRCFCANMIFQITLENLKDVVDFMARILFSNEKICQWILSCMQSRNKEFPPSVEAEKFPKFSEEASFIHRKLLKLNEVPVLQLCRALHAGAEATFHEYGWCSYLCSHLKLYCILVNLGGMQPIHEEVMFWLRVLSCMVESSRDEVKSPTIRRISKQRFDLGVTFLFLVPAPHGSSLIGNLFRECVLFFLGPSAASLMHFEQGSEIALWLIVQLLSQGCAQVSEYCSKAIGMKIKIPSTCWEDVCRIAYESQITSDIKSIAKATTTLQLACHIVSTNGFDSGDLNCPLYGAAIIDYSPNLLDFSHSHSANQWMIECLFQLLKFGHFARYGIDITPSIMSCILLSEEPINPIVIQIIEIFAKASSTPISMESSEVYELQPLPYSFLASVLKPFSTYFGVLESVLEEGTAEMIILGELRGGRISFSNFAKTSTAVHAILVSYYVLCREHFLRDKKSFGNCKRSLICINGKELSWSRIWRSLPLEKLLAHMESHLHLYEDIFGQWVGLAVSLLPEYFHISHLIQKLEADGEVIAKEKMFPELTEQIDWHSQQLECCSKNGGAMKDFSIDLVHQVLRNSLVDSFPALELLKAIPACNVTAKNKIELQIVIVEDMIPLLLDMSCPLLLHEAFCQWWCSLDQVSVELLIPIFCRCITASDMDVDKGSLSCTDEVKLLSALDFYQELVEQPFSILSCRTEIYHIPLLSIFLDILWGLLRRNREMCLMASENDGVEKKEEVSRALDMRDSAVCQILLENWSKMSSNGASEDMVQQSGSSFCAFLSSIFHSSPSIFRIVHFQGYDIKLIPAVVEGVNLMVHFLEYFEDSLHMVELSMLPFVVVFLSNIIRRYPNHSRSLSAARKAVIHIKCIDLETVINFLGETLEPISWFAITFSVLEPEVRQFLEDCLKAITSGQTCAGPPIEEFHSFVISSLELLSKDRKCCVHV